MSKTFIVVDGQVFISAAAIEAGHVQPHVSEQDRLVALIKDGILAGSGGLSINFKTGEFRLDGAAKPVTMADSSSEVLEKISAAISETELSEQTLIDPSMFSVKLEQDDKGRRYFAGCGFGSAGGDEEILGYISTQISETDLAKDIVEKLAPKEPDMDLVAEILRQPSLPDLAKRLAALEQKLNSDLKPYSGS